MRSRISNGPTAGANERLVLLAFDLLYNQRDYAAAERFWVVDYIQHSPRIASGRDALFDLVCNAPATLRFEPGLILADDEHVMLHGRFSGLDPEPILITVDIFRIEGGRLAEHWDVVQPEVASENAIGGLSMFSPHILKP